MLHRHPHTDRGRRFGHAEHGQDGRHLGHNRHGRQGRGGGLGRFFAHGDLRLVILRLIAEKPRHGYEIIKSIEEQVAGAYSPSPGVIYPTLTLLEELGYVTVEDAGGGKRLYRVTEAGTAALQEKKAVVDGIFRRMAETSRAHGGGPAPQIMRAMENLKLALRFRLSHGPLSEEQIDAVAAAIDAAATGVERIR